MDDALLLVDDSAVDREVIRRLLDGGRSLNLRLIEAESGDQALAALDETVRCILLDYDLPDMTCVDFLHMALIDRDVGVVILTGTGDAQVPIESLKAGAHDFLRKENLSAEMLQHSLRFARDRASLTARDLSARDHLALYHAILSQSAEPLGVIDLKRESLIDINESLRRMMRRDPRPPLGHSIPLADCLLASSEDLRKLRTRSAVVDDARLESELITGPSRRLPVSIRAHQVNTGLQQAPFALVRGRGAEHREHLERLRIACHDELTGLCDAEGFLIALKEFWITARSQNETLGVLLIGIEGLAEFERAAGIEQADACVRLIGERLAGSLRRSNELPCRIDDDRLAVLARALSPDALDELAAYLRRQVLAMARVNPASGRFVSVKTGRASAPANELESPEQLLDAAEQDLYGSGGNS